MNRYQILKENNQLTKLLKEQDQLAIKLREENDSWVARQMLRNHGEREIIINNLNS